MSLIRGVFNVVPTWRGSPEVEALPESQRPVLLLFYCPGCDDLHGVTVGSPLGGGIRWQFNGDYERPVFGPSVLVQRHRWEPPVTSENLDDWRRAPWKQTKVDYRCHSFVGCNGAAPGQIAFLADCTHGLVNRTVDIPPYPRHRYQDGDGA